MDDKDIQLRKELIDEVRRTQDPLNQMLMELEQLGEPFGSTLMEDYNPDTNDLDLGPE